MRGDVARFRSYKYSIKQSIGYNDLLDSVFVMDDKQADMLARQSVLQAGMKIIRLDKHRLLYPNISDVEKSAIVSDSPDNISNLK